VIDNSAHSNISGLTGIGYRLTPKVIETLGETSEPGQEPSAGKAWHIIQRNPYRLMDVDGIAFAKADAVALKDFGIEPDDERRHLAGNRSILQMKGPISEREYDTERAKIELFNRDHRLDGVIVESELVWLPEELAAELGLEAWIRNLGPTPEPVDLTPVQAGLCKKMNLDEHQVLAVRMGLTAPVMLLTGGAGVGKTAVCAAIAQCMIAQRQSVRGMAFAGKAADRMRSAFDEYGLEAPASTIHSALGFKGSAGFTVDMLGEDLIVIDECSMIPGWLIWEVIKRLAPGARLMLVGDDGQLPPIGYGTPFVDAIKSGVTRIHLEKNYRQRDQQGILQMADGVRLKQRPPASDCVELHLGVEEPALPELFNRLVREQSTGVQLDQWQVITYQNKTVQEYNLQAQAILNPHGMALTEYPCWKLPRLPGSKRPTVAEIRVGDKVLVIKNSTLYGIFNGQTGTAIDIVSVEKIKFTRTPEGNLEPGKIPGDYVQHIRVRITGRDVDIPLDVAEKYLQLGYVVTVHKAQGSDWERVIVMQPEKVRDDTARRFFYTSISRAKNHLVVVSTLRVVAWWTNAASDAPDVPSSLARRLAQALCAVCGHRQSSCTCGDEFMPEYDGGSVEVTEPSCSWCSDLEPDCVMCHPEQMAILNKRAEPFIEVLAPKVVLSQAAAAAEVKAVQSWRTLRQKPTDHAAQASDLAAEEIPVPAHVPADLHAMFRSLVRAGRE
jgi:exodeoxyribonuclease V alpha subunit